MKDARSQIKIPPSPLDTTSFYELDTASKGGGGALNVASHFIQYSSLWDRDNMTASFTVSSVYLRTI